MTVREASCLAAGELSETSSPMAETHTLLCSLMGWKRHEIFLNPDRTLTPGELGSFSDMVARRRNRVPLQHITGCTDFMGREFSCGPEALVPRPETEILVETVLDRLPSNPDLILDVGTGSGIIAVTLALEYPEATVIGTDVSGDALSLADLNRGIHRTMNLILVSSDLLCAFRPGPGGCLSALVANPPYIPSAEMEDLQPEVRLWDPAVALDGGTEGMVLLTALIERAPFYVRPGGVVAVEVGCGQADRAASLLSAQRGCWSDIRKTRDLAGIERVVSATRTEELA